MHFKFKQPGRAERRWQLGKRRVRVKKLISKEIDEELNIIALHQRIYPYWSWYKAIVNFKSPEYNWSNWSEDQIDYWTKKWKPAKTKNSRDFEDINNDYLNRVLGRPLTQEKWIRKLITESTYKRYVLGQIRSSTGRHQYKWMYVDNFRYGIHKVHTHHHTHDWYDYNGLKQRVVQQEILEADYLDWLEWVYTDNNPLQPVWIDDHEWEYIMEN